MVVPDHRQRLGPHFISELFHTRFRYTATGFGYNVAFIIGAAVPPLVGTAIAAAPGAQD